MFMNLECNYRQMPSRQVTTNYLAHDQENKATTLKTAQ